MERATQALILDLLDRHAILTLATVREDGWPQATTVGYVNDGLTLYVGCGTDSQKLANIRRCPKVSLTIDHDEPDWSRIQGLSMAATAEVVSDPAPYASDASPDWAEGSTQLVSRACLDACGPWDDRSGCVLAVATRRSADG